MGLPEDWVASLVANRGWRLLMISGHAGLLTFFIRLFVPESERWRQERGQAAPPTGPPATCSAVCVGGLGAIAIICLWVG